MDVNHFFTYFQRYPILAFVLTDNKSVIFKQRLQKIITSPVRFIVYELSDGANYLLSTVPQMVTIGLCFEVSNDAPDVVDHFHFFVKVNLARHPDKVELVHFHHVAENVFHPVAFKIAEQAQRTRLVFFPTRKLDHLSQNPTNIFRVRCG